MNDRVTNSDIDQRVANLEHTVGTVKTELAVIQSEQNHLRELLTSGFQMLGARLELLGGQLNQIATDVDDPSRTVAGRGLHSRLELVEKKAEMHAAFIATASGARLAVRVMAGAVVGILGGVGAVLGILQLLGVLR